MPTLYTAFSIFTDPQGATRHALEARVLADEAPEAIALKAATSPEVVQCYESIFFDVRSRRANPDYILYHVVGLGFADRNEGWPLEAIWKFFGYFGGAEVLNAVMQAAPAGTRPASPTEATDYLRAYTGTTLEHLMAVAAHVATPLSQATALTLLRMRAILERQQRATSEKPPDLAANIQDMLERLPFTVGRERATADPALAAFDDCPAELRAAEMLRLAWGLGGPDLTIKAIKFPEPSRPEGASPAPQ
jgi:hypothetical protein